MCLCLFPTATAAALLQHAAQLVCQPSRENLGDGRDRNVGDRAARRLTADVRPIKHFEGQACPAGAAKDLVPGLERARKHPPRAPWPRTDTTARLSWLKLRQRRLPPFDRDRVDRVARRCTVGLDVLPESRDEHDLGEIARQPDAVARPMPRLAPVTIATDWFICERP